MIAILERQNVAKRTAAPVPDRARRVGVRWSSREIARPRAPAESPARPDRPVAILALQHPKRTPPLRAPWRGSGAERHSFLRDQLIRRAQRRRAREAERRAEASVPSIREKGRATPRADRGRDGSVPARRVIRTVLRNPWLYVMLAVLGGIAVLVPAFGSVGIPLTRAPGVALPTDADVDPTLYNLLVPDTTPSANAATSPVLLDRFKTSAYRTVTGDSLSKIAARFKLNIDTIVSWNGIRDARSLRAGMDLVIPNHDGLRYTVRRGDTLQGIASTWGVDFNGILDANMITDDVITVGQDLFLPGARMSPTDLGRVLGSLFLYPVQGRISSWFGVRPDPFTGVASLHNGLDIVNKLGTPVLAAMAGTVRATGTNFSYGNFVIIQHAGGFQTLYGHMRKIVVVRGEKVSQGEEIGELGSTGYSTGPHLHFSVFRNGEAVDPLRFLK